MKLQKLLMPSLLCLLIAGCKEEDDTPAESTAEKLASIAMIENRAGIVYGDTLSATHDSVRAINAMAQWLLEQPEVDKVYFRSVWVIDIEFKNGLTSSMLIMNRDANGKDMYRGSGGGSALKQFNFSNSAGKRKIPNNKILVIIPFARHMYGGEYNKDSLITGGPEEMEMDVVMEQDVKLSTLNLFSEYKFIIINTHGTANGFFLTKLVEIPANTPDWEWTTENVTAALIAQGIPPEKFENGELIFTTQVSVGGYRFEENIACYLVTDKFIRNASIDLSGAVIFGNYCYSGFTADGPTLNNVPEAFRSKGAASYYGYAFMDGSAAGVTTSFAERMEDSLLINLVKNGDSTGIAHLANDVDMQWGSPASHMRDHVLAVRGLVWRPRDLNTVWTPDNPFYCKHFFDPDYTYDLCGDTLTDTRDGQKYATVCIGDQVWMAQNLNYSNNNSEGNCYQENAGYCNSYGRLYTYEEVVGSMQQASETNPSGIPGICPEGWHVPSYPEWEELFIGIGASVAGKKLKSTTGWGAYPGTDDYGFALLPGGIGNNGEVNGPPYTNNGTLYGYSNLGAGARAWTCSHNANSYFYFMSFDYSDGVAFGSTARSGDLSYCRCVKD